MSRRQLVSGLAAVGAVGIGTGGLVAGVAAPAFAFTGTCPTTTPTAVLVADDICEVRLTSNGTFTVPAGITKLSAVLIGAGGEASYDGGDHEAYAGNGGEIVYLDSVSYADGVDLGIVVGVGGTSDTATGIDTSPDVASGGDSAGGSAGCIDGGWALLPGDGAAGPSTGDGTTCVPGPGYALSAIPGVDPVLWPVAADDGNVYSRGGIANLDSDPAVTEAAAGTGADVNTAGPAPKASDGLIILRFAPPPPAPPASGPGLANTGSEFAWPAAALAGTAALAGAVSLILRRRRTAQR